MKRYLPIVPDLLLFACVGALFAYVLAREVSP